MRLLLVMISDMKKNKAKYKLSSVFQWEFLIGTWLIMICIIRLSVAIRIRGYSVRLPDLKRKARRDGNQK